jgi:hypothetical protein
LELVLAFLWRIQLVILVENGKAFIWVLVARKAELDRI